LPPTDVLKSETWEGNHIWTGRVKVTRSYDDNTCAVQLIDQSTGALFASCPLHDDPDGPKALQPASDSSRCFVLRVEQGDQFAYLGMNFSDRSAAFNFTSAVLERKKRLQEVSKVAEQDRRLMEGQMLKIDLDGKIKVNSDRDKPATIAQPIEKSPLAPVGAALPPVLVPPTGAGKSRRISALQKEHHAAEIAKEEAAVADLKTKLAAAKVREQEALEAQRRDEEAKKKAQTDFLDSAFGPTAPPPVAPQAKLDPLDEAFGAPAHVTRVAIPDPFAAGVTAALDPATMLQPRGRPSQPAEFDPFGGAAPPPVAAPAPKHADTVDAFFM